MESYLTTDGARALLVLLFAIGQAVMAYLPDAARWTETISSRSADLRNPVVPIDWAFAIWGLIFLSCLAFAGWQLLPGNLDDPLARQIGWAAAALFAGNVLWEYYVPKRALDFVSVAIILVELGIVLWVLFTIAARAESLSPTEFWLVFAPFQIFAGWVSAAVFVNTASALQRGGTAITPAISAGMIGAAGALGAAVAWETGGWLYAGAVAWALFGLIVANTTRERNPGIATLAGLLIPAVLGAVGLAMSS